MHYRWDAVGFTVLVFRDAIVRVISERIVIPAAKLPRRVAVRLWWIRRGNPDFILLPPGVRDLPAGLGYRIPMRAGDPFTGASWLLPDHA